MKKILSFLLALTVVFGALTALPLTAAADDSAPLTVPQIRVVTENGNGTELQKDDGYVNASITITDVDGSTLSGDVLFKVRGNSTAASFVQKKAFTFKFDAKKNVLGMGKAKKWALLANAYDPTLMRNYIALELARGMGMAYTSEQKYVELWVDGDYRGCYTLTEPIQEGKDRVNIDIDSNAGMKDFLIEREVNREEEGVSYFTIDNTRWAVSEPEEPNEAQFNYIQNTMTHIVNTLKTGSRTQIEQVIDIDSFTRYYLLNELFKTLDFDYSSVFFYYQDGILYAGPVWDYDLAAGNENPKINAKYNAAYAPDDSLYCDKAHLYQYLCAQEWFVEEVKKTYRQYYPLICSITAADGMIDSILAEYGEIFNKNFTQTPWYARKWVVNLMKQPLNTFAENVTYLRDWLTTRNEWLVNYYELFRERYLFGDADGDSKITILDATKIQRLLAALITDDDGRIAIRGNIAGDDLDILDATLIQRYLVGFSSNAPFEQYFYYESEEPSEAA